MLDEMRDSYEIYLHQKAQSHRIPISATFELSPLCNLNCRMCYIVHKKQEVDLEGGLQDINFWIETAKKAKDIGVLFILLTGGEPFLYPNFKELYIQLHKMGFYISINTNATMIDEDVASWLSKYPPRRINISIYGGCQETYTKLTQNSHSFDKVINAIELLQSHNISLRFHSVINPLISDDYNKIIELGNKYQVPLVYQTYLFPPERKYCSTILDDSRFDPITAARWTYKYDYDRTNDDQWKEHIEEIVNSPCKYKDKKNYGCNVMTCRGGKTTFWVNWKGQMGNCGFLFSRIHIDLKKYDLNEAWERLRNTTENIRASKKCAECIYREYCHSCVGAALSETGKIDGTPEYLCDFTREYVSLIKDEYKRLQDGENK